jgi:hypothetical protein
MLRKQTIRLPTFVHNRLTVVNGSSEAWFGGAGRNRTDDPLLAKQVLSQLSYSPRSSVNRETSFVKRIGVPSRLTLNA